jgi:hypothetical protein
MGYVKTIKNNFQKKKIIFLSFWPTNRTFQPRDWVPLVKKSTIETSTVSRVGQELYLGHWPSISNTITKLLEVLEELEVPIF